jgi:hypothetical protein
MLNIVFIWLLFNTKIKTSFFDKQTIGDSREMSMDYMIIKFSVSIFRTAVLIITSISIFAVDFKLFPQALKKTNDFGNSLMDLGFFWILFYLFFDSFAIIMDKNCRSWIICLLQFYESHTQSD